LKWLAGAKWDFFFPKYFFLNIIHF
jgi:hypothetical protein